MPHREDVADALIHVGASSIGKKIPERNSSGSTAALTIGGAASALGIAAVSASASAAKLKPPTSNVRTNCTNGMPVGTDAE